jgi:hypothetical protein
MPEWLSSPVISILLDLKENVSIAPHCEHMPTIWLICEANALAADFASILGNHLLSAVDNRHVGNGNSLRRLIAHLLWCKARAQGILYSLDRIEAHEKMVLQYFQD